MYRILLALLLVLLAQAAAAQDAGEATGEAALEPAVTYTTYYATDHGFAIDLPDTGTISSAASEGWNQPVEVAVEWRRGPDDPIEMINIRADVFGADLDSELFNKYCDVLLGNWSNEPEKYVVVTRNDSLDLPDGTSWNLIEISDKSNADGKVVNYSVFCTYAGDKIVTVTMYYLNPVNKEIKSFGAPVITSLRLL